MRRTRWLLPVLAILLAACATTGRVVDAGQAPQRAGTEAASEAATGTATGGRVGSDVPTTAAHDQPGTRPADPATLRGEPIDWPYPADDTAEVGVVGVEAGDVLNVRAGPGADQRIVRRLEPRARGLAFVGNARRLGDAVWHEIRVDGTTGWVNGRYVLVVAGTDDITAQIVGDGPVPTAPTMRALADAVMLDADGLSGGYHVVWGPERDPDVGAEDQRRIVISDGPHDTDPGEITLDVLDLYDDSVAAERLLIVAHSGADGGFALAAVERTFFCWRGGTDVCV